MSSLTIKTSSKCFTTHYHGLVHIKKYTIDPIGDITHTIDFSSFDEIVSHSIDIYFHCNFKLKYSFKTSIARSMDREPILVPFLRFMCFIDQHKLIKFYKCKRLSKDTFQCRLANSFYLYMIRELISDQYYWFFGAPLGYYFWYGNNSKNIPKFTQLEFSSLFSRRNRIVWKYKEAPLTVQRTIRRWAKYFTLSGNCKGYLRYA